MICEPLLSSSSQCTHHSLTGKLWCKQLEKNKYGQIQTNLNAQFWKDKSAVSPISKEGILQQCTVLLNHPYFQYDKQNQQFPLLQASQEAGAQWSIWGGQSILPGSVLEPGFGVSPRAWMISTSSCPFRSCKPISTSPKPKCQNRQSTFKTIHLQANKMLKKQFLCHACYELCQTVGPKCLISSCVTSGAALQWLKPTFSKTVSNSSLLTQLWWLSLTLFGGS